VPKRKGLDALAAEATEAGTEWFVNHPHTIRHYQMPSGDVS
jgi:hypothetical protein